jgi:hypothetical protein
MSQHRGILIRVLTALLASAPLLLSQVTGRLSGTVNDPSGSPVSGARVILYLADSTVEEAATMTDSKGNFLFPALRPTYYDLAIEAANFKKSEQKGVKVDPLTETPLAAIALALGEARETVETQASANLLQTATGQVSAVLSSEQVSRLPLAFRDPLALLDILPGVTSNGRAANRTINGQNTTFSNITYDGINIQNSFLRSSALTSTTNFLRTEQLSEATIVTANPNTGFSGGSIQVAFNPPSGTNTFHGTAYWNNVTAELAAQRFIDNLQGTPVRTRSNQFGASASGPLVKNKFFYYLNYENMIDRSSITRLDSVPTNLPVASNSVIASVLAMFPKPTAPVQNPFGTFNYQGRQNSHLTAHGGLARLDYLRSAENAFSLTITTSRLNLDRPSGSSAFLLEPNYTQSNQTSFFSGSWRHASKSGKLTNELRIGANLPSIDFTNRFRDQFNFILAYTPMVGDDPQGRDDYLRNYQDNLSYVVGRHQLQTGFSLQQYRLNGYGFGLGNILSVKTPTFWPCESFAAFGSPVCVQAAQLGLVYQVTQLFTIQSNNSGYGIGTPTYRPRLDLWSGYVQDSWKAMPGLTLNFGVRYDYQTPARENTGTAIIPTLSGDPFVSMYSPDLAYSFVDSGKNLYAKDANNFSPNASFAWTPKPGAPVVVRGGYNVSFVNDDHLLHAAVFSVQNGFQLLRQDVFINTGFPFATTNIPNTPVLPSTLNLRALRTLSPNAQVRALNPNLSTPYVQQWNFAIETSALKTIFSARYVGNNLVKGLRSIDVDPFGANVVNRPAGTTVNRPMWLLSNLGRSSYNALQLEASRRTRAGLAFEVNYTFSKSLSDVSDYNQGQRDAYLDIRNPRLNRAPSPYDLRHAFKATWVYDIPKPTFRGPVAGLLSNWSTSGILIAQSGAPFSILSSDFNTSNVRIPALTTLNEEQISAFFGIRKDGLPSYVNAPAGAFFGPSPGSVAGALQPRMFNGPSNFTFNTGLRKLFPITEGKSIEFRTEAFNLFNHVNWIAGDQVVGAANFGRNVGQVNLPRRIQFLLRVNF